MTLRSSPGPLVDDHDAVLLDLDGVVYVSDHAVPEAVEALTKAEAGGAALAFLTNNAARTPRAVADHLRRLGLPADIEDVVTSAQAIARVMADELETGSRVLVCGGEGLRAAVHDVGLVPVSSADDTPDAVVQGYFPEIGWRDLAEVAYAVEAGLPWYVSNTDRTIPTARGIAPGNGSLVEVVRAAASAEPRAIAGKPYLPLFEVTVERIQTERPLMVGDRLDTDIAGARAAHIVSLAVLTGVSGLADLVAATEDERPDYVAADLRGLHQAHPPVEIDGATAACGDAVARSTDGRIALDRPAADVASLRAVVGLAWHLRDTGSAIPSVDSGTLGL
ncbi:HAD-IIA family hydrolase [Aeromicrobium sp. YIM 150415]|uniref:HAD-IIA family hydrolase n=1 Tax=Aeromicrobium sp. YIM 150415 TaxID=2803912 RepID=UPI0019666E23|nr:HAD-IIA family hydrolase [Aeromicrobium sp. YIM 150415]MBM9465428.1 HAD-IIA family hydrolase [Aeromicrobium sp. YIM 150415]